ncbi:MAG: cache domain-containing protein [Candidatus Caldatribacteriaceae bacterium]
MLQSFPGVSSGTLHTGTKTGEWPISISKALVDSQGEKSGVIAIDSPAEKLASALRKEAEGYTSLQSFVVKASGEVLVHQEKSLLDKKFQDVVSTPVSFEKPAGHFSYRLGNTSGLAYYSHLDPLQWIVVTAMEKK